MATRTLYRICMSIQTCYDNNYSFNTMMKNTNNDLIELYLPELIEELDKENLLEFIQSKEYLTDHITNVYKSMLDFAIKNHNPQIENGLSKLLLNNIKKI